MKLIKEIMGRIFALWAMVIFAGSLIIVFIPIWITGLWPEPKRTILVFKIFRAWMTFFFVFSGVRRLITGKNNFKKGENYIVVCNHNSFMDVPLTSPGIPLPNKTIAKTEMAKIPLFGMIYKRGSVLVNRKSEESRRQSFLKMKEVLDIGITMCIYPEGTRNKTNAPLQKIHDGAFRLAVESKKDIVPAVIFGTKQVLPRKPFYFWPTTVEMHFLPAVQVQNKSTQELKDEVFRLMEDFIVNRQSAIVNRQS